MTKTVLVFRQSYLPDSETFIADHLKNLRSWQAEPICEIKVANSHADLPPGHSLLSGNRYLSKIERNLFYKHGLNWRLSNILKRDRPALIHAHFLTDACLIMRCAKRHNLPLVATAHGYDASMWDDHLRQTPAGKWLVENRAEFSETVSKIFCVSNFIRDELIQRGFPTDKLVVQRLGVDTSVLRPMPQTTPQTTPQPTLRPEQDRGPGSGVLFVGRLVEKKGAAKLIEAWQMLSPDRRAQGLTIIGDGPLADQLKDMAAPSPEIRFLGGQPHARVLDEMRQSRILALPSQRAADGDSEGLPIAAMEAHSLGLPIVGFDDGPIGEAIENGVTGLIVPKGDIQAFAAALTRLLSDEAMVSTMGVQARARAQSQFDIKKNNHMLEQLYDSVAE